MDLEIKEIKMPKYGSIYRETIEKMRPKKDCLDISSQQIVNRIRSMAFMLGIRIRQKKYNGYIRLWRVN